MARLSPGPGPGRPIARLSRREEILAVGLALTVPTGAVSGGQEAIRVGKGEDLPARYPDALTATLCANGRDGRVLDARKAL